jgi:putative membrane protein
MGTIIRSLGILAAGLTLVVAAWALDATSTKFLSDAIRGNLAEVKMAKLAQAHAQSPTVREFGKALVSDHSIAFEKSSSLAEMLGMTAPIEMTAEAEKDYEALGKLSGAEFDRQFAAHMVQDHEKDLAAYRSATRVGSDPKVIAFADEMVPTLQKQLETAHSIDRELKVADLASKGDLATKGP